MTKTLPNCAVVFKTYSWDPFVERQAKRLAEAAGNLDFFISIDETPGAVGTVPFERVVRFTCADLEAAGLAMRSPVGGVLWWNPDYAHYQFLKHAPRYDYYLFVEYDCVVQCSLEQFVTNAVSRGADLVALPISSSFDKWHWWPYLRKVYSPDEVQRALLCACFQSSTALEMLYRRRLDMSRDQSMTGWPNSELFVPTEVMRAGMNWLSLSEFAGVSNYVWFPPVLEEDLRPSVHDAFLHPVLDRRRYISSMSMNRGSLSDGELDRVLSRFSEEEYANASKPSRKEVVQVIRHKLRRKIAQFLSHIESKKSQPRQHTFGR